VAILVIGVDRCCCCACLLEALLEQYARLLIGDYGILGGLEEIVAIVDISN